jgi:XTP/dITP diphosphohydrolase
MATFWFASHNANKLAQLQNWATPLGWTIKQVPAAWYTQQPVENGKTYLANAQAKLAVIQPPAPAAIMTDDSGLELAVWPSRLGIHTRRELDRYAPPLSWNAYLLKQLNGEVRRNATMVTTLALRLPDGRELSAVGQVSGEIATAELGDQSRGFDRIFWLPEQQATLAQLPLTQQQSLNQRSRALQQLAKQL